MPRVCQLRRIDHSPLAPRCLHRALPLQRLRPLHTHQRHQQAPRKDTRSPPRKSYTGGVGHVVQVCRRDPFSYLPLTCTATPHQSPAEALTPPFAPICLPLSPPCHSEGEDRVQGGLSAPLSTAQRPYHRGLALSVFLSCPCPSLPALPLTPPLCLFQWMTTTPTTAFPPGPMIR